MNCDSTQEKIKAFIDEKNLPLCECCGRDVIELMLTKKYYDLLKYYISSEIFDYTNHSINNILKLYSDFDVSKVYINKMGINTIDRQGWAHLHHACDVGNFKLVKWLLKKGANIYKMDYNQRQPILWAIFGNHFKIVKFLIKKFPSLIDNNIAYYKYIDYLSHKTDVSYDKMGKILIKNGLKIRYIPNNHIDTYYFDLYKKYNSRKYRHYLRQHFCNDLVLFISKFC